MQEWEWMNKFQDKVATEKAIRHTNASSRSNILQNVQNPAKSKGSQRYFLWFQRNITETLKEYHGSPQGFSKMGCPSQFHKFYSVSMIFYGIPKGCIWNFNGIPVAFQRISIGFLCDFYRNPLFHDISIKFWWSFFEITIRFQKDSYGNWQGFL